MKEICPHCHEEYDSMFMPWEYVNNKVGTEFTKRFICPLCKSTVFIE